MKRLVFVTVIAVFLGFATLANAALTNNGGGFIYDSDLNITWYDFSYVNPATNGATWQEAINWASGLNAGGVSGWRLPTTSSTAYGDTSASGGEMGHLYYAELGLSTGTSLSSSGQTYFVNIKDYFYWTGVDYPGYSNIAFTYEFDIGREWDNSKTSNLVALAVHSGNIGPNGPIVPIPAAIWLLGSGLIGLIGVRRYKK
jgi:hypothetical protein